MTDAEFAPVTSHLQTLVRAAGPDVQAPAEWPASILQSRKKSVRRRRAGIGIAVVAVVVGSLAAMSLRPGPYFDETQPSAAMEPAVPQGSVVTFERNLDPEIGDVVLLEPTADGPQVRSISRVLGRPGDTVSCPATADGSCRGIEVDGERLRDRYLSTLPTEPFEAVRVPLRSVFVMGDARTVAVDSRIFGPVSLDVVAGVAVSLRVGGGATTYVPGAPRHSPPDDGDLIDPQRPVPPAGASPPS